MILTGVVFYIIERQTPSTREDESSLFYYVSCTQWHAT
ncbi:hypothetical protein PAP10c_p3070 (plasmid) [Pantoea agglomerans]|jgi:hypothetical protein|nr:hypothetical protein PAP10c_p3070 [Pantoea agglomerans]